MKALRKFTSILLLSLIVMTMACTTAFADNIEGSLDGTITYDEYVTERAEKFASWGYLTTDASLTDNPQVMWTKDGTIYYLKSDRSLTELKNRATSAFKSDNITSATSEITNGMGIEANTQDAMYTLQGFVPVLNIILGGTVVIITLLLAMYSAFDICYIVFPVFRAKCDDSKVSGQGPMVKRTANGGTKLRFVSDEAQYCVEKCSIESGQNPIVVYLGKRIVVYIAVSIVMFILLTGNINIFTDIALKVVKFIMDVIQGLKF